jgi:hypothetical protein
MSRLGNNRLATTQVLVKHPKISITESALNNVIADVTTESQTVAVEQYFISAIASGVACTSHNTMTQDNVQAAIEQLETQFSKGATDPTTETEPFLDEGDLFYNTNTNQLKVYRDTDTWDILLQAEGDMDTLDGSTF